jgi:Ca2+-dependent lipid-binding protein|eukprot:SAG25_NODE_1_length_41698_cov_149.842015_26_plen_79_part_00
MLGALSYVIFQLGTTRGSPLDEPQKSSVKHKTLNPKFNEAFTFHLDQGSRPLLSVTVMDRDGLETGEPVRSCARRLHL